MLLPPKIIIVSIRTCNIKSKLYNHNYVFLAMVVLRKSHEDFYAEQLLF